jgi:hypothetical protein
MKVRRRCIERVRVSLQKLEFVFAWEIERERERERGGEREWEKEGDRERGRGREVEREDKREEEREFAPFEGCEANVSEGNKRSRCFELLRLVWFDWEEKRLHSPRGTTLLDQSQNKTKVNFFFPKVVKSVNWKKNFNWITKWTNGQKMISKLG